MGQYNWEGTTRSGQVMKGVMEAPSEDAVKAQLRSQNIAPGKIKEAGKGFDMELKIPGFEPKVTTKDLVVVTRQFATMIDAGLPLVQCLDILGKQQENKTFKKNLVQIKEDVESGSTFADALKKHPKAFDSLYVNLVAAKGPYAQLGDKSKALADNVRSLWAFSASTWHAIAWADGKVQTWADIKGKRVYIGPPAGAANAQIRGLIKAASGFEEGKDYEGIKAPWGVATAGFQDGQYDLYIGAFSLGSQALVELSLSRKIRLLGLSSQEAPPAALGMQVNTIPAGTYPGMVNTEPVTTWQTLMMMAVRKDLSDDLAYKLTKTYFESLPALKAGNAALAVLSADDALSGLVPPLHPGALKYYQEVGRAVPPALVAR